MMDLKNLAFALKADQKTPPKTKTKTTKKTQISLKYLYNNCF